MAELVSRGHEVARFDLAALNPQRPPRFVFISSGETYPEGRAEYLPVDERHPRKPSSFYGETKLPGDRIVEFPGRKFGMHREILRMSHTQDAAKLPASMTRSPSSNKLDDGPERLVLSRGEDGTPYMMHIAETRDTARGIVLALESDPGSGEASNIGLDDTFEFDRAIPAMGESTTATRLTTWPFRGRSH